MRFWDSSALVPLFVVEPASRACRGLLRTDPAVAVWYAARAEIVSALRRQQRDGSLTAAEVAATERRLERASERWVLLEATDDVEHEAVRLLARHPLRAADAFQLAAALCFARGLPKGRSFVCRDSVLCAAAEKEGFDVVHPRP